MGHTSGVKAKSAVIRLERSNELSMFVTHIKMEGLYPSPGDKGPGKKWMAVVIPELKCAEHGAIPEICPKLTS